MKVFYTGEALIRLRKHREFVDQTGEQPETYNIY